MFRWIVCGECQNARRNDGRMRSRFPKPFFMAISSAEKRPPSIVKRQILHAAVRLPEPGDRPVSFRNTLLNCCGLENAAFAKPTPDKGELKILWHTPAQIEFDRMYD
jgi:hypothetical protein